MIQYNKFVLNNGLRVLVHEDHSTPMAVADHDEADAYHFLRSDRFTEEIPRSGGVDHVAN